AGAGPALADAVGAPDALHLQVGVDAEPADPDEQVLAVADDLVDPFAGKIEGGVARHPEIAAHQRLSRQRQAQAVGGEEDGVTLRHGSSYSRRPPLTV